MSTYDRARLASGCRRDSWDRLAPRLAAMHIPSSSGPEALVQLLDEAGGRVRADAQRVLRALERQPWRVQALEGPYRGAAKLGFHVHAGSQGWWLQFEPAPRLRIVRIETLSTGLA
jgi:hypothetical protein